MSEIKDLNSPQSVSAFSCFSLVMNSGQVGSPDRTGGRECRLRALE